MLVLQPGGFQSKDMGLQLLLSEKSGECLPALVQFTLARAFCSGKYCPARHAFGTAVSLHRDCAKVDVEFFFLVSAVSSVLRRHIRSEPTG